MENPFKYYLETGQFDFSKGHVRLFNTDMVVLPTPTLVFLHKNTCGKKNENKLFYDAGCAQIKTMFAAYGKTVDMSNIDRDTFYNLFTPTLHLAGFGKVIFKKLSYIKGEKTIIYAEENPFAQTYKKVFGIQENGVDQFLLGLLETGYVSVSGSESKCKETKCIAKGDEYCEFVIDIK